MTQQPGLFLQQQTWAHYIGKTSYPSDAVFLKEAQEIGVSRRVPAFLARHMNFGDRVILLRWLGKGRARAFAEMQITGVTLESRVSSKVIAMLGDRASCREGGDTKHYRGCGAYIVAVTCTVRDVSLPEIIEMVYQAAEAQAPFVMLQGRITRVITPAERLEDMRFTRGFFRFERVEHLFTEVQQNEGALMGIRDYSRTPLPLAAAGAPSGALGG